MTNPTYDDLFNAILAMDAFNRGYDAGLDIYGANRTAIREKIEAAGATLRFLPPLQPGLQPYRKSVRAPQGDAPESGRTQRGSGLWSLIGKLVDIFQPDECANYFRSCGYDPE
jgi:transposase